MFNLEDYETVEERLIKFWKDHPDGRIDTKIIEASSTRFIVQAYIYRTEVDQHAWSSGLAEETISGRGVNATSALENAETSAIGRALASAGYATKGKRPSREEMSKVKANEPKPLLSRLQEKIITPVEDDPWTVKAVEPAGTITDALALMTEVMGATKIDKDIPQCVHGAREWRTGNKNGRAWANMGCSAKPMNGERWSEVNKCEPIWYVIDSNGAWKLQEVKA